MRLPLPGTEDERAVFELLQRSFVPMYRRLFSDDTLPRTIVVVPSLSLPEAELAKLDGVLHYEERMLCLLLLLQLPNARIVYASSLPIEAQIIDYHLGLMPDTEDARHRLTLISVGDPSLTPLSQKLMSRADLMTRIRSAVHDPASAHLTCFVASSLEQSLAVQLGIPMYAPDPNLWELGRKSEGRRVFRAAGIQVPPGVEDVASPEDVLNALRDLPSAVGKAVVKLDEGFSGEGNAVVDLRGEDPVVDLSAGLRFESDTESWPSYRTKLSEMGGVVEAWIEGDEVRSPSVQCRVNPLGEVEVISTHDQLLGGPSGQVFLGCTFPADRAYRSDITDAAVRVGLQLAGRGVVGRFGVDFLAVGTGGGWDLYGIEINLRKGGTTLPFLMLDYLARGRYLADSGEYLTPAGRRSYVASDNVSSAAYRGMSPARAVAALQHLGYERRTHRGVVLHLLGALREHGKLGMTCIADTIDAAHALFDEAVTYLESAALASEQMAL